MRSQKAVFIIIGVVTGLALVWFLGPRAQQADLELLQLPDVSGDLNFLEDSIKKSEAAFPIRKDNEARIIWATPHLKTEYSIVYLHGNVASQEEGDPIHEAMAARYGCNMFLARLSDHGLVTDEPMKQITAQAWLQSALDAIAVGQKLGNKVIVVSCSTGSTLALALGALFPDLIHAHILLSPNIDLYDKRSFLLAQPWGLQIGRAVIGSKFYSWEVPDLASAYWYRKYRVEGLTVLKRMVMQTMTDETFSRIDRPVFLAYYHKDAKNEDNIVSVPAMKRMFSKIATPVEQKREVALADANTHIIASDFFNKDLETLWKSLTSYCEEVLQLPVQSDTDFTPYLDKR